MIRRSVIISDEKIDSFISAVLDRSHAGIPDPEMAYCLSDYLRDARPPRFFEKILEDNHDKG